MSDQRSCLLVREIEFVYRAGRINAIASCDTALRILAYIAEMGPAESLHFRR